MTLTTPRPLSTTSDEAEALFKEARQRRQRRWVMSGCLLGLTGLAAGLFASSGGSPPKRPKSEHPAGDRGPSSAVVGHPILRGDGIGNARFGQAETVAIRELDAVLGKPLSATPTNMARNCTIDSGMQWPILSAYFFQGHFVGYGTNSLRGYFLNSNARTVAGLRIGDSLVHAQVLYGAALRTSYAQGGSWFVTTSAGTQAGLLTAEVDQTSHMPKIADITAGHVGCPAASP
jgi:hypothetical protein